MNYGVDVGAMRLDDVDKKVLARVRELVASGVVPTVFDIGGGEGGLAVALAENGAVVTLLDIGEYSDAVALALKNKDVPPARVQYVHMDIRTWQPTAHTTYYDCVVLQRVLHYLSYDEAKSLLVTLRQCTHELYLAVTGLTTEIARYYAHGRAPLTERWGVLEPAGQELFSITAPLCLYSDTEIITLLAETGWEVVWHRVSDFGNVKVVAKNV